MSRRRNRAMRTAGRRSVVAPSWKLPLPLGVRRSVEPDVLPDRWRSPGREFERAYDRWRRQQERLRRRVPAKPSLIPSAARNAKLDGYEALRSLWMIRPSRVLFCVRRRIRREVLFAVGRAGYSGSAPKRHYRRTDASQYSC